MKKYIAYITIFSLLIIGCEKYTEGINKDPNNFNAAAPELIVGQAQLGWIQLSESNSARYAGVFVNQFTGSDRQYITLNGYSVTAGEFNDMWDDAYVEGITQAQVTKVAAAETKNSKLAGVAQIAEAALFGEMTALYGNIPFTQANKADENFAPVYDGQASIYQGVQGLLDEAITNVGSEPVSLYSGNRLASDGTWGRVAHSLKARYYLHTKNYASALSSSKQGLANRAEDLSVVHGTTAETGNQPGNANLYYQFTVNQREGYLDANGSHLFNLLDPSDNVNRLLATPGDANRKSVYFDGTSLNTGTGGRFALTATFPLISWYEVKLIEAEAAHRTGDEAAARTAFNAVRAELAVQFSGDFPPTTSTGETLLKEILEEKYITLVGEIEAFHDVKRTNNLLGVPPKTGSQIPQRFIYPQNEIDNNENIPSPLPGLFDKTPVNN